MRTLFSCITVPVNAIDVTISPFPQASRWAECTGGSGFWVSDDPADHGTVFLVFTSYSISNIIWVFKVPFTMPVCWYYVRRLNNRAITTSSWTPCSGFWRHRDGPGSVHQRVGSIPPRHIRRWYISFGRFSIWVGVEEASRCEYANGRPHINRDLWFRRPAYRWFILYRQVQWLDVVQ